MLFSAHLSLSERALILSMRAFEWFSPKSFRDLQSAPLGSSKMLHEHHALGRWLLPLFFKRIRLEAPHLVQIQAAQNESCIVYVSRFNGQLEYLANAQLFAKHGLPLAEYSNHIYLTWWINLSESWLFLKARYVYFKNHGHFPHQDEKQFYQSLQPGRCIYLNLPVTSLLDPALFHASSHNPLTLLLKQAHEKNLPVTLVPVEFLWDRYESKRVSLTELMGLDPENFSYFRRIILFWKHYFSSATVRVGEPVKLEELSAKSSETTPLEKAENLRQQLLIRLHIERRSASGTPLRPRSWFLEQLFRDEQLLSQLTELAQLNQNSTETLLHAAHKYARKMIAAPDPLIIQAASIVLNWLLHKLYRNIEFRAEDIETIKKLASQESVVLVPNHRSHMDYLLLSTLLHKAGITLPLIAAGDNLSFWPLGAFFRRGGAFFIQRSFRDQPVYRLVIEAYLRLLVREHYLLEFFIEGTRSRSGKLLPPRMGLLKMLLAAAKNTQQDELIFIPVGISYERTLEVNSYVSEAEGKAKRRESHWDLLKAGKIFWGHKKYGELSIAMGAPISSTPQNWQDEEATCSKLAQQIMHDIALHLKITPQHIVAASLLSFSKNPIAEAQLKQRMQLLWNFLQAWPEFFTQHLHKQKFLALEESLQHFGLEKWLQKKLSSENTTYSLEEKQRLNLEYFKNGLMHLLALPSLICWLALKTEKTSLTQLHSQLNSLHQVLRLEFPELESVSQSHLSQELVRLTQAGILCEIEGSYQIPKPIPELSLLLASLIEPILEAYALFAESCQQLPKTALDEKYVLKRAYQLGKIWLLKGRIQHPQALNQWYFKNALKRAEELGALSLVPQSVHLYRSHPQEWELWEAVHKFFTSEVS